MINGGCSSEMQLSWSNVPDPESFHVPSACIHWGSCSQLGFQFCWSAPSGMIQLTYMTEG